MNSIGRTEELDTKYRDFGRYMIGYLEVQDARRSKDTEEEGIMFPSDLHWVERPGSRSNITNVWNFGQRRRIRRAGGKATGQI